MMRLRRDGGGRSQWRGVRGLGLGEQNGEVLRLIGRISGRTSSAIFQQLKQALRHSAGARGDVRVPQSYRPRRSANDLGKSYVNGEWVPMHGSQDCIRATGSAAPRGSANATARILSIPFTMSSSARTIYADGQSSRSSRYRSRNRPDRSRYNRSGTVR
jgi:hypothetical protein